VNPGSLLPALSRMERAGSIRSEWHATENNRRAKYYTLTAKGR
jgi:PadR family transcriptional regulator, regulatory protein PadR